MIRTKCSGGWSWASLADPGRTLRVSVLRPARQLVVGPALVRPHPLLRICQPRPRIPFGWRRSAPRFLVGAVRSRHLEFLERDLEPRFLADADAPAHPQARPARRASHAGAGVAHIIWPKNETWTPLHPRDRRACRPPRRSAHARMRMTVPSPSLLLLAKSPAG